MAPIPLSLEQFPVRAKVKGDTVGYVPLYHALHAALRLPKEFRPNETGGWIGDDMKAVRGKTLAGGLRVLSARKTTYRGVSTHYLAVSYAAFDAKGSPVLWSQDNDPDRPTSPVLLVFSSPKGVLALTAEHLAAAAALRAPADAAAPTKAKPGKTANGARAVAKPQLLRRTRRRARGDGSGR